MQLGVGGEFFLCMLRQKAMLHNLRRVYRNNNFYECLQFYARGYFPLLPLG